MHRLSSNFTGRAGLPPPGTMIFDCLYRTQIKRAPILWSTYLPRCKMGATPLPDRLVSEMTMLYAFDDAGDDIIEAKLMANA